MTKFISKPLKLPEEVSFHMEKRNLSLKGPKGTLHVPLLKGVEISYSPQERIFSFSSQRNFYPFQGLTRSLVHSALHGVTKGFQRKLTLVGIGMKAEISHDGQLLLRLGRSHDFSFPVPPSLHIECQSPTSILISGISKNLVTQTASQIRSLSPPDPYKGKGIRYQDEKVILKEKR